MGYRSDGPRPGAGTGGGGTASQRPPVRYFHEGRLREELVDKEAEEEAMRLANVKPTPVRAYFFEVISLRRRVEQEIGEQSGAVAEAIFLKHRPQLKMLRAKVHYAKARGTITEDMKDFIEKHVQAVNSFNDFMAFCTHFEAVVAFHRGLSDK